MSIESLGLLQYDKFMQTVEEKKNVLIDALLILPQHKTVESENYNAGTNSDPFSSYIYIANMKKISNAVNANLTEVSNSTDFMIAGDIIGEQINASIRSDEEKKYLLGGGINNLTNGKTYFIKK